MTLYFFLTATTVTKKYGKLCLQMCDPPCFFFVFFFVFKYCLLGVTDDRGKFIYISPKELEAVAKFIKQRGRVTISELAESSNTLVNLQADHTHTHTPSTTQVSA